MGSYFGSELCSVDTDMDGTTDILLVAAPFYHIRGEEGRVYVYHVREQVSFWPRQRPGLCLLMQRRLGEPGLTVDGDCGCSGCMAVSCPTWVIVGTICQSCPGGRTLAWVHLFLTVTMAVALILTWPMKRMGFRELSQQGCGRAATGP